MKSAVVTGATGFIGSHLVAELVSRNVDVTVLCLENDPGIKRLPEGVNVVICGMDDYSKLPAMWNRDKPDVFYHLAWEGATGPGRADAVLQVKNMLRTLEALTAANEMGCGKFVAAGTVYENFREQIARAPEFRNAGFYILSKCYTRDASRQLAYKLGIDFYWCTFCHPVGRYMKPEQLLAYAVQNLINGISPAFGTAMEPYDIIAVEDLAVGLYLAGETKLEGTDHFIGSGEPRILREYLEEARRILAVDIPIAFGAKPDDGMRFNMDWFNGRQFAEATGFKAKVGYAESVLKIRDYLTGK